jgi:hypothetical protein
MMNSKTNDEFKNIVLHILIVLTMFLFLFLDYSVPDLAGITSYLQDQIFVQWAPLNGITVNEINRIIESLLGPLVSPIS